MKNLNEQEISAVSGAVAIPTPEWLTIIIKKFIASASVTVIGTPIFTPDVLSTKTPYAEIKA